MVGQCAATTAKTLITKESSGGSTGGPTDVGPLVLAGLLRSASHYFHAKGLNRLGLLPALPNFLEFDPQQPGIDEPLEQGTNGDFCAMHQAEGERQEVCLQHGCHRPQHNYGQP